ILSATFLWRPWRSLRTPFRSFLCCAAQEEPPSWGSPSYVLHQWGINGLALTPATLCSILLRRSRILRRLRILAKRSLLRSAISLGRASGRGALRRPPLLAGAKGRYTGVDRGGVPPSPPPRGMEDSG